MSTQPETISEIIKSINSIQPNVNPTEIYNEGWMTRLLVYYSIQQKLKLKKIDFGQIKNWTSEGQISNPFLHAKEYREGYTHADMALGDFDVNYKKSGRIKVDDKADVFGIIEAKMKSSLSAGTTYAPTYDQASRNVACIACNVKNDCNTFFYVVAPKTQLTKVHRNKKRMIDMVKDKAIEKQIKLRIELHNEHNTTKIIEKQILERVEKCNIDIITYEEWIKAFQDKKIQRLLDEFYDKCRQWNRIIPFKK